MPTILRHAILLLLALALTAVSGQAATPDADFLDTMVLGEIPEVFSALKFSQGLDRAPASMTVITAAEIRRSGARTLGDILKYVPGIYVTNSRSGFDLVKIRGSQDRYNNRILLLIDGVPRRELFFGYKSISELVPVENIRRLEIIRGPGSALYGTDAYSGVINIFTKEPATSDLLTLDTAYGSFDRQRYNATFARQMRPDLKLTINGRYITSNGYPVERGRDGYRSAHSTSHQGHNLDAKLQYGDFLLIASLSSLDYPYPWRKVLRNKDRAEDNLAFALQYDHDLNSTFGVHLNIYHNRFDFREDLTLFNPNGSIKSMESSIQENSLWGLDSHLAKALGEQHKLVAGLNMEREATGRNETLAGAPGTPFTVKEWLANDAGEQNFSLFNFGLYLEDLWQLTDRLELTLGLRYDNYEQFGDAINPRVAMVYGPVGDLTVKLLYGEAFRGPTYKELFIKTRDKTGKVVPAGRANPDLNGEKIRTGEAEISYNLTSSLLTKLRYFYNRNEDTIISLNNKTTYANLDGITSDGVEIELEYNWHNLSGFTNFTYTHGEKSDGSGLDGYPDYQINSVLRYQPNAKLAGQVGVRFISDRSRPVDYHNGLNPADPELAPLIAIDNLGSYYDVECSLSYQLTQNWGLALHVYNLLDDKNYNPSYEPGEYWDLLHAGRSVLLNLSFRLPQ